jgi:DNA-binding IclR family transcriptional regulator
MGDSKLTVRAVERALDILLCFREKTELTQTEIAHQVQLHKSTVHRLIASLESKGFVLKDEQTDKYRLGFRIWELSAKLSKRDDIGLLLLPELERLRDLLGETISLYIQDGIERVRIQSVESQYAIRRVAPVGARMPLHVGASSKVLVAFAESAVREGIFSAYDWPSYADKQAYMQQLIDTRRLGYATSVEEREPGAAALAAPMIDRSGRLIAALAVSGPANRLTLESMQEQAPILIESARRMVAML